MRKLNVTILTMAGHVDIVFPRKVGVLTYAVPEGMALSPGVQVEAELRNAPALGVVIGPSGAPPRGRAKPVGRVLTDAPALGQDMVRLLQWASEYYMCLEGLTLKAMLPEEFFTAVKPRGRRVSEDAHAYDAASIPPIPGAPDMALGRIADLMHKREYAAHLLHAPTIKYEYRFVLDLIDRIGRNEPGQGGVLVLVPSLTDASYISAALRDAVGEERLVTYHSAMPKGARSKALERMASGGADVVIGSRSAVFAPLMGGPRLICVLHEEAKPYKAERHPMFNARDVGVMRAYLAGAQVLLSSICPSVESRYNADTGKYVMHDRSSLFKRPRIRTVGVSARHSAVSDTLRAEITKTAAAGGRSLVYINRLGYGMLACAGCGRKLECPECHIAYSFHKGARALKCNYCGRTARAPERCPKCGAPELERIGAGLERVAEELAELKPVGVTGRSALKVMESTEGGLAIGTRTLTRTDRLSGSYALAGILNADAYMGMPDFRSEERALQDMLYAAMSVSENGQAIVQTRMPRARIFSWLRKFDFQRYYEHQLRERRESGYPPFARMAFLTVKGGPVNLSTLCAEEVLVLGPAQVRIRTGAAAGKWMFKAPDNRALRNALRRAIDMIGDRDYILDIDPVEG